MKVGLKSLVAAAAFGAMAFSATSNAAIYRWTFEQSGSAFAFLDFDTSNNNFRIFDNPADNYLSGNNGVNGIAFVANNGQTFNLFPLNVSDYATDTITLLPLLGPLRPAGYNFAYTSINNREPNEVNNGESVSYNFGNIDFANIGSIALRVNTNNSIFANSPTWVAATSVAQVPEAETSAMMALGLGVLGFVARRRKQA